MDLCVQRITRGTRWVVIEAGAFVQEVDYQPYGEVKNPSGATPRTTDYVSEQFNGGDFLAAFGIVKLGARLYDPTIGRLPLPRSAADPAHRVDHQPLQLFAQRSHQQRRSHGHGPGQQATR